MSHNNYAGLITEHLFRNRGCDHVHCIRCGLLMKIGDDAFFHRRKSSQPFTLYCLPCARIVGHL